MARVDEDHPAPMGSLGPFLPSQGLHLAKGNSGFKSSLWDAHSPHGRVGLEVLQLLLSKHTFYFFFSTEALCRKIFAASLEG